MVNNFSWVIDDELAGSANIFKNQDTVDLFDKGIRAIVTLTANLPPMDKITELKISHLHLPITDFSIPSDEQIYRFLRFMDDNIPNNPVAVHCFAGIGRTGTMLAIYLVWRYALSGQEAIDKVRKLRYPSIETNAQEQLVKQFAENLHYHKQKYSDVYSS